MRKCDSCGKLYQENKDVFCPYCGAVAQKQCTHSSSFDSKRYDRGEIYKSNNSQYQHTTYNKGYEPHAQRKETQYKQAPNTYGDYGDKIPKFNLPDLTKMLQSGKGKVNNSKYIVIIIIICIIAFNFLINIVGFNDTLNDTGLWEDSSEVFVEEDIRDLYTVVDEAKIEIVDTEGEFKTFTIEIGGMGFDDYLPENMQNDILSGAMTEQILSEDTFVDVVICDFSNDIVNEESYNNALNDSNYFKGKHTDGKCKYRFTYSFDYDEIVHIVGGVNFYLDNGLYINAELPFSAFSLSEDGKITYYTTYADSDTAWNTVFSECSNEQEIYRDVCIDFDTIATEEGEETGYGNQ